MRRLEDRFLRIELQRICSRSIGVGCTLLVFVGLRVSEYQNAPTFTPNPTRNVEKKEKIEKREKRRKKGVQRSVKFARFGPCF